MLEPQHSSQVDPTFSTPETREPPVMHDPAADQAAARDRRRALMERMGPGAVAIVPGAREVVRSRDTHHRFRQDSDFHYLTAFPEPDAVLVLAPGRPEGQSILFVRPRNAEREQWDGRRAGPEGAVKTYGVDEAFTIDEFDAKLPKLLEGREELHYTLGEQPDYDLRVARTVREIRELSRRGPAAPHTIRGLEASLHEARLLKSPHEMALMRRACAISARAHARAMRAAKPGLNEWQLAAELHTEFTASDAEPGYGTIVAGGENACILHYTENNQALRDGDLVLIDAGAEYRGYTGDITRTFPVNGRFSGPQRDLYEVVLLALEHATATLVAGTPQKTPMEVATRVLTEGMVALGILHGNVDELIAANTQKRFFMHGIGHWLGLDVHDVGRYRVNGESRPFEPGMVMTIEPGLYIPHGAEGVPEAFHGLGIRVEDDILVTDNGPENLTDGVVKSVADIEAFMRAA